MLASYFAMVFRSGISVIFLLEGSLSSFLHGLSVLDILYDDGVVDTFQIGVYFFVGAVHDGNIWHTAVFHILGKSAFRIQICHCEKFAEGQRQHFDLDISSRQKDRKAP